MADIIIGGIAAIVVIASVYMGIKRMKSGKPSCGCENCSLKEAASQCSCNKTV